MMRLICAAILVAVFANPGYGQLTVEQRTHDFVNLASLYAKRYAPYEWKKQLFNYDLFELGTWLERVRTAKDDLEFFEICSEYVAGLDDLHSSFRTPSNFLAYLSFDVDLYGDKALIESINRSLLPVVFYPFQVGDELVSVDGKTVDQSIAEYSKLQRGGTPVHTRRAAVDLMTFRPQGIVPRVVELGSTARVEIRRASGELQEFTIPWLKAGLPLYQVGPVPFPDLTFSRIERHPAQRQSEPVPYHIEQMEQMQNWKVADDNALLQGVTYTDEGELAPRRYVLGWGSRAPRFRLPANFVQRLGRLPTDFHFSGTYQAEGLRIGYIRFPNFAPSSIAIAIRELETEIAFFQENTDGLVVDVMRNTGGGCYMVDAAARLIPYSFYSFGEELRVTVDQVVRAELALRSAVAFQADDWIIRYWETVFAALRDAYRQNRGRTSALPNCIQQGQVLPPGFDNNPAAIVYRKPLIVLIDEFSTSAGDIFAGMLQDNRRGPLVGTRTNGAGGSTSGWPAGFYSEGFASNTNSLIVRKDFITVPGFPPTRYIENVGVHADIPLDFMTRENLMTGGQPFVNGFTQIIIGQIRAAPQ